MTVKVDVDSAEALARLRELADAAEPVSTLLETKRDWLPYIFGVGGWIAAIVAILR